MLFFLQRGYRVIAHGTLKTYRGFPHGMPTAEARASQQTPRGS
jgi:hypothetical protein